VADRSKAVEFFKEAFGYKEQSVFELKFDDGTTCDCIALEPPEKSTYTRFMDVQHEPLPWSISKSWVNRGLNHGKTDFHLAPEIFVSEGQPGSIVEQWVKEKGSGIHHLAYQVDNVEDIIKEWKEKGYAEFCSEEPLTCPGLTQVFTKPSDLTGIIYEFITRGEHGFCTENVKALMESTVIQS
jgi:hypothetical protein